MEIVMYTGRPKPLHWVELSTMRAVLSGKTITFVASCREQAEATFQATSDLLNGRGPGTQSG